MINILVMRGQGDRPGPDITDPLITTPAVALARGVAEIDRQDTHRQTVTVNGPMLPDVAPGSLVHYARGGDVLIGKLTSIDTTLAVLGDTVTAGTTLALEVDYGR